MIQSFRDGQTERVFLRERVSRWSVAVRRKALAKLQLLNAAVSLNDLQVPPGNRLEPLRGKRRGQHSIRVNAQWRICFRWTPAGPTHVELTDYH